MFFIFHFLPSSSILIIRYNGLVCSETDSYQLRILPSSLARSLITMATEEVGVELGLETVAKCKETLEAAERQVRCAHRDAIGKPALNF